MFPQVFFGIYLLASIVAFRFGPTESDVRNPLVFYSYVLTAVAIIVAGFRLGVAAPARQYVGKLSGSQLLRISIMLTLVVLPATISQRSASEATLTSALLDPGAVYRARLEDLQSRGSIPVIAIVRGLMSPVLAMLLPLGVLYLRHLPRYWAPLWLLGVLGIAAESILSGTAKSLFDIILVLPWLLWLRYGRKPNVGAPAGIVRKGGKTALPVVALRRRRRSRTKSFLAVLLAGAAIAGGLKYFSYSRQSRFGMEGNEYPLHTVGWSTEKYGVPLPEGVEYLVYSIIGYWTQGYQGLSECLELPFVWTGGVGHSTFLMNYAGQFVGDRNHFLQDCYPVRLEQVAGYDAFTKWHTIFPWLASDLTFPGAALFVGLMAFLLARAWRDAVTGINPLALAILTQLLLMFYYVPANNVRLSFSEEALAFWSTLALWLMSRGRLATRVGTC